jgi:hypothetical protein
MVHAGLLKGIFVAASLNHFTPNARRQAQVAAAVVGVSAHGTYNGFDQGMRKSIPREMNAAHSGDTGTTSWVTA